MSVALPLSPSPPPPHSNSSSSLSLSLTAKAKALYHGEALAPMVRASTTPLRILALNYGADFVYTEELVDRAISETIRVENSTLQTIDYIKDTSKLSKKVQKRLGDQPALLLRIDPKLERHKLVCQLGTGEPELALAAALHVQHDVDAFDINMGCPKKFSISGGMGAALLSDPDRACRIVKTLRNHLDQHPVSCKIRLLKDTQSTVDFVSGLVNAGAHAIAIHARRPGDDCTKPAQWEDLEEVVPLIRSKFPMLPLLVNGDFYTRQEFVEFQNKHGTSGVLLARPALYNASIFRKPTLIPNGDDCGSISLGYDSPLLLDKTTVVQDYLKLCVRYNTHYKNVKYVVGEMMTNRRTPTWRVPFLPQLFPGRQTIGQTCSSNSLQELCQLWNVQYSPYNSRNIHNGHNEKEDIILPAGEHKYDDAYILKGADVDVADSTNKPCGGPVNNMPDHSASSITTEVPNDSIRNEDRVNKKMKVHNGADRAQ